ncbi:MAG: histidine phosphatase family protein [Eubacteriales bacterium]|nr:histidine phosphatase family protein [Eubacteriales bacterium]
MKLIFVRHADPDYSIDSLTPTGWKEAEALRDRIAKIPANGYYVSPLGRARDTAKTCLEPLGIEAEIKPWLREFNIDVKKPNTPDDTDGDCVWDWMPIDWKERPNFFLEDKWFLEPELVACNVKEEHEKVIKGLDDFLSEKGYVREGLQYKAVRPNHDTYIFFCHFGLECVLIAHLINTSPMILWHGMCSAPSGVSILNTEERMEGIASWRMSEFGDISHLYAKGMEPSFHARFCECFTDDTIH